MPVGEGERRRHTTIAHLVDVRAACLDPAIRATLAEPAPLVDRGHLAPADSACGCRSVADASCPQRAQAGSSTLRPDYNEVISDARPKQQRHDDRSSGRAESVDHEHWPHIPPALPLLVDGQELQADV